MPNVVGAAAMGWVFANPDRAATVRARHLHAALVFSFVTAVFQIFFLFWIVEAIPDAYAMAALAAPTRPSWTTILANIVSGIVFAAILRRLGARWIAVRLWIASASALGYVLSQGQLNFSSGAWPGPTTPSLDLLLLAPVVVFGFLLCPYLDLTFLEAARSQTPGANRASFSLGFGVLFFVMILFTLGYAWALMPLGTQQPSSLSQPAVLGPVIAHIVFQLLFTTGVQVQQGLKAMAELRWHPLIAVIAAILTLGPLAVAAGNGWLPAHAGLSGGEVVYRCFMSCYGLIFPAYVWLCMIPTRDGHSGISGAPGRRKLIVLGCVVALAAPCYWIGFIERVEWWLVPGLAVVLLARVVVSVGVSRGALERPSAGE